ncbi:hypothetical protein QYF50_06470 [Paenibacillus vini]|nr:hypothetical protein [Paenibacillus vini]MDN4067535.1 hypothetical protein [Paenibacillus vini]
MQEFEQIDLFDYMEVLDREIVALAIEESQHLRLRNRWQLKYRCP